MKDYGRIITKINQTPWLITPEGLQTVLSIVSERLENGRLSEDELETRLASLSGRGSNTDEPTIINGVGVLPVQGPIFGKANMMTEFSGATSMEKFQQDFRAMMANDRVDSILMDFDTPGGTSDLIEEVGQEIYDARGTKPIYSSVNTMCGSAGLWLAMQADKVFSTPSGTVGSLGAYTVHQDQSGADAKNGVKFTYIKAGQYKTEGNPHEPLSPEGIQYRQEQVNELMDGFLSAVARGRNTSVEYVKENYGQGRMLTPKNALEVGMIDAIASYDDITSSATVNRARPVQVVTPSGESIAASIIGGVVYVNDEAARFNQAEYDKLRSLVSAGTIERTALGTPAVTLPNPRKEDDTMKLSAEALTALGLSADATDEQVGAAIMAQASELAPLKELRTTIESKKKFADEYPEEYAMMTSLQENNKKLESAAFSKSYMGVRFSDLKTVKLEDGSDETKTIPTTKGLSGLALEKIEMSVGKINNGSYQLSDFKETLDSIMLGGIVDYGQVGTVTGVELEDDGMVELSSNTLVNRTLFSNKVLEVMEKDKVDQDKAIEMVATKHPELWAAYKSPHVHA